MTQLKLFFILFFTLTIVGCMRTAKCPNSNEIKNLFNHIENYIYTEPPNIRIFMDGSKSFAGFVENGKNCDFLKKLHNIYVSLPDDSINFYKVGAVGEEQEWFSNSIDGLKEIQNVKFFNYNTTDLTPIFNMKSDTTAINILFTDGIFTSDLSKIAKVKFVKNLNHYLLDNNAFFALFCDKAEFKGTYYPQTSGYPYHFSGERPYLCIVFGNRNYLKFIEKKFENLFDNRIYFGKNYENELKFKPFINPEFCKNYVLISNKNRIIKIKHLQSDTLEFYFKPGEELLSKNISLKVDYRLLNSENQVVRKNQKGATINLVNKDDISYLKTKFKLPQTKLNKSDLMLIKLSFIQELPEWIEDISIENDDDKNAPQNIYQFKSFVSLMLSKLESVYEYKTLADYYICIRR